MVVGYLQLLSHSFRGRYANVSVGTLICEVLVPDLFGSGWKLVLDLDLRIHSNILVFHDR